LVEIQKIHDNRSSWTYMEEQSGEKRGNALTVGKESPLYPSNARLKIGHAISF